MKDYRDAGLAGAYAVPQEPENLKQRQDLGDCCNTQAVGATFTEIPIREVKLKQLHYRLHNANNEAEKIRRAIDILERHPEFMECIELLRSGLV